MPAWCKRVSILFVSLAISGFMTASSVADLGGNNGTIKIDGIPLSDSHQGNEPHVGCVFAVDFYGYDQGNLYATVTFEDKSAGNTLLESDMIFIGGDPAGGGTDLDASKIYDLGPQLAAAGGGSHQGYHAKVTVHAQGSHGADTKHKVFWTTCPTQPGGGGGGGGGSGGGGHSVPPAHPAKPVEADPAFTG